MARKSGGQRLAALAAYLAPAAVPYYVAGPAPRHRLPGWYWHPEPTGDPIYLGYNHIDAHAKLLATVEDHQRTAEAA